MPDDLVLAWAAQQQRVVLTINRKDIGASIKKTLAMPAFSAVMIPAPNLIRRSLAKSTCS